MFYIITFSFLSGIVLRSFLNFDLFYLYVLMLLAIVVWVLNSQNFKIKFIALAAIFLFLGFLRFDLKAIDLAAVGTEHIGYYNGSEVELAGVIVEEPDIRETQVKYTLGYLRIKKENITGSQIIQKP